MLELRTARANSVPHSTLRSGRNPRKGWTIQDRLLALALTMHEDGLCKGCGQPRDRSWNEDMDGYYVARRVRCQACEAVHMHVETDGRPRQSDSLYVVDSEPGYEPDPRMMPS